MDKKYPSAGTRFGKLVVIGPAGQTRFGDTRSLCRCDCGKECVKLNYRMRRGETQTCGCGKFPRKPPGRAAQNAALYKMRRSAKARNLTWDLKEVDVIKMMGQPCHWCGMVRVNIGESYRVTGSLGYNGIDRVDNGKGYTYDNSVPCCRPCNFAKHSRTVDEFLSMCRRVVAIHGAGAEKQ